MSETYLIDSAYLVDSDNRTANQNCKCTICHNIFNNPKACGNCLNHFCSRCIARWQSINPLQCPLCKTYIQMRAVPVLKNLLSRLQFFCPHRQNGCQQIIPYDRFVSHSSTCPHQTIRCRFSTCPHHSIRKQMPSHQQTCQLRPVQCPWCKITTVSGYMKAHLNTCEEQIRKCEICVKEFRFGDLKNHVEECPMREVGCRWCEKNVLAKDQTEHQNQCEERQVKCLGCRRHYSVREFYEHQNTCEEYPIVCCRCNQAVSRKIFAQHDPTQCISYLSRKFTQDNNLLKQENVRLKEKVQELERNEINMRRNFGLQGTFFSLIRKDQDIYVNGRIAAVREHKRKRRDRYAFIEREALGNSLFSWKIKANCINSEWFAVGITEEANLYLLRRYHTIGHCTYLISANGTIYSHHNEQENQKQQDFSIVSKDQILCQYIPALQILRITNLTKNKSVNITLSMSEIHSKRYFPCVCLRCGGDSVQLLDVITKKLQAAPQSQYAFDSSDSSS